MIFLDLGYQPFANKYLTKVNQKEKKYRLLIDFNKKTKIVSIKKKFLSKEIFKKDYPYRSSMSKTMKKSFKGLARIIKTKYKKDKILEIGCNDGVFLENFNKKNVLGIEPCLNIAKLSKKKGINVLSEYWTNSLSKKIKYKYGKFDIIFSANTITHIKNYDEVFNAIKNVLDDNGLLIIQDPSLLELIKKNAYDQFYNEHIYVFSYLSLTNILHKHDLEIFNLENIQDHGGSIRYYIKKKAYNLKIDKSVKLQKKIEIKNGLHNFSTYKSFKLRIERSKIKLIELLRKIKIDNKKIIGYGATAKAVTVLNYCGIDKKYINYFVDTTPEKQNKYMPGVKIPVKKYHKLKKNDVDYAFLGAWNFKKEIFLKEKKFIQKKGKFISHIPFPKIIP
jgi:2-polyprenyl-3-methyl-5-hydroxy-6-metoxy-1,4-benzoquinol methylase